MMELLQREMEEMKNDRMVDKQIDAFIQLNEKLMNNSSNYANLIMVAGYAGFSCSGPGWQAARMAIRDLWPSDHCDRSDRR